MLDVDSLGFNVKVNIACLLNSVQSYQEQNVDI